MGNTSTAMRCGGANPELSLASYKKCGMALLCTAFPFWDAACLFQPAPHARELADK
jgi:hypothetical protein